LSISTSSKVVVASDQHLGYANSDSSTFLGFLDSVNKRSDIGTLVILGDFIDMWRRDVSGLFFAYWGATQKLVALSSKIKVVLVAGNHDYHALKLEDHEYPFQFLPDYSISSGGTTYEFKHGWEFDLEQQPLIMELLCYNLSDSAGADRTAIYNAVTGIKGDLEKIFGLHGGIDAYLNHITKNPEARLQPTLSDVERRAFESVGKGEILIFGHTHRPFVSSDGRVANSGSWVTDSPLHDTYVELDGENLRLFTIDASQKVTEILARIAPPALS
jgi:UDP-2,3-diacylglucosamine pyrophosphatase LpxH